MYFGLSMDFSACFLILAFARPVSANELDSRFFTLEFEIRKKSTLFDQTGQSANPIGRRVVAICIALSLIR